MAASATSAIRWASQALMAGDLTVADQVVQTAAQLERAREQIEETVGELLVRQQPVASDLRLALASLHVAGDVERMGALARHVAKIVMLRHPVLAVPVDLMDVIGRMGQIAEE